MSKDCCDIRKVVLPLFLLAVILTQANAATVLVEAESFADHGGWLVDQQSMDVMGSAYLLAHGLGRPVADATTTVTLAEPGEYRVWVRTKDWVARWNAPGAPGKFQLLVNGKPLTETFGTKGADWFWHDGGTVRIDKAEVTLALHDLTGFEGRCDAIVLTTDGGLVPPNELKASEAFRHQLLCLPEKPDEAGAYDLVVVGGGLGGCTAAVSAARLGLSVALVQDRPVLGGNSSSEVRVWIGGRFKVPPYPVIGEIVAEMFTRPKFCPGPAEAYGDEVKLRVVQAEKNLKLFLNEHVDRVEMKGGRIQAVVSKSILTGRRSRFVGRWFVDNTGDGTVGFLAGADYETTAKGHMGTSNLWHPVDTGVPSPFPRCEWALDLTDKPFPTELKQLGQWFWESGFDLDTIEEAEAIRDHNLRAMYGAWDCMKNVKNLYPTYRLDWAAAIAGKRESRRLLGDVVLTKEDVVSGRDFPDGCVSSTWSIDLHYPNKKYMEAAPENPFISVAQFTRFTKNPYPVPYRCLYSRNVPNLMMAGRNVSVTHEALGTVRVMATGGLMGEVLGRAAAICKKHDVDPRAVYEQYLDEFKQSLWQPTKSTAHPAAAFAHQVGANIALGTPAKSSGDQDSEGHPAGLVVDGAADTSSNEICWVSKGPLPHWIELRWAEPKTITAARMISGYRTGEGVVAPISDFVLQRFDGKGWLDIPETATRGNSEVDWQCRFKPVTTQRVRLLVQESKEGTSRIWELELYEP